MLQFICEDCMQYIYNVDFALKDIQKTVLKNGNYLKEYKNEFDLALKKSEAELKQLLTSMEKVFAKRLEDMNKAQEVCVNSVAETEN